MNRRAGARGHMREESYSIFEGPWPLHMRRHACPCASRNGNITVARSRTPARVRRVVAEGNSTFQAGRNGSSSKFTHGAPEPEAASLLGQADTNCTGLTETFTTVGDWSCTM